MMVKFNTKILIPALFFFLFLGGCEPNVKSISEMPEGYQINKNTGMTVILITPLSSNDSRRGDTFKTILKSSFTLKDKIILHEKTEIRGLVKRVVKYEKFGDRANLLLLFDQIVLPDGIKIPLEASLDTEKGSDAIKIKGEKVKAIGTVGSSAIIGTLIGNKALGKDGASKGLVVGATAGAGAVLLSDMMEINLPEGTELTIKLDEPLFIPKK